MSNQKKQTEPTFDVQQEWADEAIDHPDAVALKWLEENCSTFTILRERKSGYYKISGTLHSKESGYVVSYVVRDQRNKPKGPYYIHEKDTVKEYRKVKFEYRGVETLARAVETIILTYAPGDVEVGVVPLCQYNSEGRPLVFVSSMDLESFQSKPEALCDLSNLEAIG